MKIIEIYGETESTKVYEPCTFVITADGKIYSESKTMGFFERTEKHFNLERHLDKMRKMGFTIREMVTVTAY